MKVYTVHLRRPVMDADRDFVLVKEGFSWPGFLISILWALWHRMWIPAAGFLAIHVVWSMLVGAIGIDPVTALCVDVAIAVGIGMVANDLRRWTLAGRGYTEQGVVTAANADAAAARFLDQRPDLRAELPA